VTSLFQKDEWKFKLDESEYISFIIGIYNQMSLFYMNGKTYNGIMKIDFINHNKDDDHVIKSIIL